MGADANYTTGDYKSALLHASATENNLGIVDILLKKELI